MDLTWSHSTTYSDVPTDAVFAGSDSDGAAIYVGRAGHDGDLLPAKIIPSKNIAYVCYDGQEIPKYSYELLRGTNFTWESASGGSVPRGAILAGQTAGGEYLFVGRGEFEGSLTPGKVHPSHGCLYIPYGGSEVRLDEYEVLVQPESWLQSSCGDSLPSNAVFAGQDSDGTAIYVGRAYFEGDLMPCKVIPQKNVAYVAYNGREESVYSYELLTGSGYTWIQCGDGVVPPHSIIGGSTSDGETLYIGRANMEGSLTPGKIHPSHQCLYIPYDGQEHRIPTYEVLVRQTY